MVSETADLHRHRLHARGGKQYVKTRTSTRAQDHILRRRRYRGFGVQRLEVLIAVMLARERLAAAGGGTPLAAALASLSSGPLSMIADAVAALGVPHEEEEDAGDE